MRIDLSQSMELTQLSLLWKCCIFAYWISRRFLKIEKNDAAFNGVHWPIEQLYHKIWLQLIEYEGLCGSKRNHI
uniref:Uncharacterized protein n=1 Tax=Physcomitrium patens TaxID=3218 RepID=A0A2K1L2G1_PHYPA|nr:hypothetical protein PHYPA_002999 [Physcomitrium patens]